MTRKTKHPTTSYQYEQTVKPTRQFNNVYYATKNIDAYITERKSKDKMPITRLKLRINTYIDEGEPNWEMPNMIAEIIASVHNDIFHAKLNEKSIAISFENNNRSVGGQRAMQYHVVFSLPPKETELYHEFATELDRTLRYNQLTNFNSVIV